ncbi:MAG: type II and III secretion system protein family protein [Alphaproteobacteria bacterium]|nr:type II and III secretion system protein family protein [Alphaproteobacteria bacterium]
MRPRHKVKLASIRRINPFLFLPLLLAAWLLSLPVLGQVQLQPGRPLQVDRETSRHAGEFVVPVNKSQILSLDQRFSDLLVGNSEIADVLALTDRTIYVLGKKLGSTSLTIYAPGRQLIAVLDLTVGLDTEGLKSRLHELMPSETIEVRAVNGSLVLSGTVSSASALSRALAVAERYAPGNVSNLLSIRGSQQVMLEVRFAEVSRNLMKDISVNTNVSNNDFSFTTGTAFLSGLLAPSTFGVGTLAITAGSVAIDLLLEALERKGVVKTLAEPNLIAMSGDTASFLAGGEFPVPVAQQGGAGGNVAITVEFKEFGVSLAFTPTVLEGGMINLLVAPEVSRIDPNNSVTLQGFVIPGLTTRRARTTVELRDGESFAIAGLIQSDFQDTVRQFPGLAEVPILGALMRSSDFQRNETELVIIVTPRLVKPTRAGRLLTPADGFLPPSDFDLFLMGRPEAGASGQLPAGARALGASSAGGIVGAHGHIVK